MKSKSFERANLSGLNRLGQALDVNPSHKINKYRHMQRVLVYSFKLVPISCSFGKSVELNCCAWSFLM